MIEHRVRKCPVACWVSELVLGSRDRGDNVAEDECRIPQVAIVDEWQRRQNIFQHLDRITAVK
jgi:hypothetical protein